MRSCRLLDHWPAASLLAAVLAATSPIASAKDYAYQSPVVETAKVNESGTRHDADRTDCIDAPPGELIKQVSVKTQMPVKEDADQASCVPNFQEYVEVIPGVREPRRVCLRSAVTSVGGIFNFGKRGRVQCAMTYSTHEGISQLIDEAGSPKGLTRPAPSRCCRQALIFRGEVRAHNRPRTAGDAAILDRQGSCRL